MMETKTTTKTTKTATKGPTKAAIKAAEKAAAKQAEREIEERGLLMAALKRVAEEKNIPVEALIGSIEGALVSAYKKAYGGTGAVRVEANLEQQEFKVFAQKLVVQRVLNPNTEIAWREARLQNETINLGDGIETEVTPSGFGRIAAQTAKQVLLQKLREAERVQVASEYANKSGQMFRGAVSRMERGDVIVTIGKAEALLPRKEMVQGEHYAIGKTIYVYVLDVRQNPRGPAIKVSRTHPGLVRQLFTLEVPEIGDGIVELKNVAREPGQRTKIAVAAENPDVDPVGACIGPRGGRVQKVLDELGNEKVDIVRWNADPIVYISNALSPAQISKVILTEHGPKFSAHGDEKREESRDADAHNDGENEAPRDNALGTATVIVSEDQQSLAIGKQGQNVRLAARLTGWRIDIRTEKQYAEEQAKRMFEMDKAPRRVVAERVTQSDEFAGIFSLDAPEENADGATQSAEAEALAAEVGTSENTTEDLFSDSAEAAIVEGEASIAEAQAEVPETGDDTLKES
jgi:N utilization substance protein A